MGGWMPKPMQTRIDVSERLVNVLSLMVVMVIQLLFHRRVRNAMEHY